MKLFIPPREKINTESPRPIVHIKKLALGLAGGLAIGGIALSFGGSLWWLLLLGALGASFGVIDTEPLFPASWFKGMK